MRRFVFIFMLVVGSLGLACSGGGSSPTESAPPVLEVGGNWNGTWIFGTDVSMTLLQAAGSSRVTGTVVILGNAIEIEGTTVRSAPGQGTFDWRDTGDGCGSLTGNFTVTGGTRMSGLGRLSTLSCPDPDLFEGTMTLLRGAAKAGAVTTESPSERENLERGLRAVVDERR